MLSWLQRSRRQSWWRGGLLRLGHEETEQTMLRSWTRTAADICTGHLNSQHLISAEVAELCRLARLRGLWVECLGRKINFASCVACWNLRSSTADEAVNTTWGSFTEDM